MRILFMCFLIFGPSFGHAIPEDGLTNAQATRIQKQLADYFDTGSGHGGDVGQLVSLRPWIPTIDLLLKELLKHHANVSPGISQNLMVIIHDLSVRADPYGAPNMLESMSMRLDKLLHVYRQPSKMREMILETVDRFKLWDERYLWFIMEIRTSNDVIEHSRRIRQILPKLDDHYKPLIADLLRSIKPQDLATLSSILDTGQMREKELVTFFRMASVQFAKVIQRAVLDDESLELSPGDAYSNLIADKLRQLMKAMRSNNDAGVGSAFTKAVEQARNSRDTHYNHDDRLLFFTLFQEGRLNWHDRSTWYPSAVEVAEEHIPLRDRFRVDGNVILVEFGAGKRCADAFDKD